MIKVTAFLISSLKIIPLIILNLHRKFKNLSTLKKIQMFLNPQTYEITINKNIL